MPIHFTCNYIYFIAEIRPLRWDFDSLRQEIPKFSSNQLCFFLVTTQIKKTPIQSFVGDLVFHLKRFSCFTVGSERHFEHFYFEAQALYVLFRRELEHIRCLSLRCWGNLRLERVVFGSLRKVFGLFRLVSGILLNHLGGTNGNNFGIMMIIYNYQLTFSSNWDRLEDLQKFKNQWPNAGKRRNSW